MISIASTDQSLVKLLVAFQLFVILTASGCSTSMDTDCETSVLRFQSPEFLDAWSERAEQSDLWHLRESTDRVRFCTKDSVRVAKLSEEVALDFLPLDRSVSYAPELHQRFREELERANIPYREQRHDSSDWVIWSERDAFRVRRIQKKLDQLVVKNPELLNRKSKSRGQTP